MRVTKILAIATALTFGGFSANAGGLAPEIMQAPVVVEEAAMEPAGSSVSATYVIVGILAALLIAASMGSTDTQAR